MNSENYEKSRQERRAARLKDLFEPKSYTQEWQTMYYACVIFTPIAQIISAALAVGVPAYFGKVLFGSWLIGLSAGLVAIVLFELMKRNLVSTAAKLYYKNELSTKLKLIVLSFALSSIIMSGFGTPILVKEFAPIPEAPTEAQIVGTLDSMAAAQIARFEGIKTEARQAATRVHAQNNWKGVTVTAARGNILQLEQQAKAASDSIAAISTKAHSDRAEALATAQAEHQKTLAERKSEIENVGWIFAGVCLALEVLFLVAMFWLFDYKYHEYCEIEPTKLTKLSKQRPQGTASEAPQIGFHSEGQIVNDGNRMKIYCRLAKSGKLKAFDASDLSAVISNTKGDRKEYFIDMKKRLNSAK